MVIPEVMYQYQWRLSWPPLNIGGYSWCILFSIMCVVLLQVPNVSGKQESAPRFDWMTSEWTKCLYHDRTVLTSQSCCDCYRKRNVTCVYTNGNAKQEVPPFYCRKIHSVRPTDQEKCSQCVQNCVLSHWGDWTPCSGTCGPSNRRRIRTVLYPGTLDGQACGPLVEVDWCQGLSLCDALDPRPEYTWRVGDWTSCRKSSSSNCADGLKFRQVTCVHRDGHLVSEKFCLHFLKGEMKPSEVESCPAPCDCKVSNWSDWGPCSITCQRGGPSSGFQVRTRNLVGGPKNGGRNCPALKETRACPTRLLRQCPSFTWYMSDWGECGENKNTSTSAPSCTAATQTRDVICIKEGDDTLTPVHDVLCLQDALHRENLTLLLRPPDKRACQVPCYKDCQLGEWENWSACTQSCGTGGNRIRTRPILVEPVAGGQECAERYEAKGCESTPCTWWHVGRWSKCFLDDGETCGEGSQIRSVYCLTPMDDVLEDAACDGTGDKPPAKVDCKVPCPEECTVSDWSVWGSCSKTCGPQGGVQERTRKIIGSRGGPPCLSDSDLRQVRTCNQRPCKTYHWQVSAWSRCTRKPNVTTCGEGTGVQTRQAFCEIDPGTPLDENMCNAWFKPELTQDCAASCPQDCQVEEWSHWSECSATCGRRSYRVRRKRITQWGMNGGTLCPEGTTNNGAFYHKKRCKRLPPCHSYLWMSGKWGSCDLQGSCGHGIRSRNVSCMREDFMHEKEDVCYDNVIGLPPSSSQKCFEPCQGDCLLGPWGEWGACSQTCGDSPGTSRRTRQVLNIDPAEDLAIQCPHLKESDLTETQPCGVEACPEYHWEVGDWSSCVVHKSKENDSPYPCGDGVQRRHVLCMRQDQIAVEPDYCDSIKMMPERHRTCLVDCPSDCQMNEWAQWSDCSVLCGIGVQVRSRTVSQQSENGGRKCGELYENITCSVRNCDDFVWKTSAWGDCQPYYNIPCGQGQRTREVKCPAGPTFEDECNRRSEKPASLEECDIPCPGKKGECVMGSWSEWSECSCGRGGNSTKSRTRTVLSQPKQGGEQCGEREETSRCQCHMYNLEVGPWSTCQVKTGSKEDCGRGMRQRPVNCMREDGVAVPMTMCGPSDVDLAEPCLVPCPEDCELNEATSWSACTAKCGMRAFKSRWHTVSQKPNEYGRQCPAEDMLTQNMTCHTTPCFEYSWSKAEWNDCSVMKPECGMGSKTRTVICQRSDGQTVEPERCLKEDGYDGRWSKLDEAERVSMDLHDSSPCGDPCPGDCQVGEWSEYGPCFRSCTTHKNRGMQVRTRVIIAPSTGGAPCPRELIQARSCSKDESMCPIFTWQPTPWSQGGKRRVNCITQEGHKVQGGCVRGEMPAAERDCRPSCGHYANCIDGECVCLQGFSGDGYKCLPEFGCEEERHCVLNDTYCDTTNKECLCYSGLLPNQNLICAPLPVSDSKKKDDDAGLAALFLYILIGSVCALMLLLLCILLLILRRRRQRQSGQSNLYNNASVNKIDNLDTGSMKKRNNEELYTPESPQLGQYTLKGDKSNLHQEPNLYNLANGGGGHKNGDYKPGKRVRIDDEDLLGPERGNFYPNNYGQRSPSPYHMNRNNLNQDTIRMPPEGNSDGPTLSTFKAEPVGQANQGYDRSPLNNTPLSQSSSNYDNIDNIAPEGSEGDDSGSGGTGTPPPVLPRPPETRPPQSPIMGPHGRIPAPPYPGRVTPQPPLSPQMGRRTPQPPLSPQMGRRTPQIPTSPTQGRRTPIGQPHISPQPGRQRPMSPVEMRSRPLPPPPVEHAGAHNPTKPWQVPPRELPQPQHHPHLPPKPQHHPAQPHHQAPTLRQLPPRDHPQPSYHPPKPILPPKPPHNRPQNHVHWTPDQVPSSHQAQASPNYPTGSLPRPPSYPPAQAPPDPDEVQSVTLPRASSRRRPASGDSLDGPDNALGRQKNPASTKLLEYCDELIAELQNMASS